MLIGAVNASWSSKILLKKKKNDIFRMTSVRNSLISAHRFHNTMQNVRTMKTRKNTVSYFTARRTFTFRRALEPILPLGRAALFQPSPIPRPHTPHSACLTPPWGAPSLAQCRGTKPSPPHPSRQVPPPCPAAPRFPPGSPREATAPSPARPGDKAVPGPGSPRPARP